MKKQARKKLEEISEAMARKMEADDRAGLGTSQAEKDNFQAAKKL